MSVLQPVVEHVRAAPGWSIGVTNTFRAMVPLLAAAPSAELTRAFLILGVCYGQPAEGRRSVGEHDGDPAVLAEFDALPEVTNLVTAHHAMKALARRA